MSSSFSFLDCFSGLKDPRASHKILYPLSEILLLILCGTLIGADNFVDISLWGRTKLDFLRRLSAFEKGVPSHDTLNDVLNALDTSLFSSIFIEWAQGLADGLPDMIHVDGKTSRRACGSQPHDKALHVVSAWASRQRLVLGQEACQEKSNEIKAIPQLLEQLYIKGALITIDAMGCQTKIADKIIEKEADYLLALKNNQRSMAREVELYFEQAKSSAIYHETIDADHGRIEQRRHYVSHDVKWMVGTKKSSEEQRFKSLACIGMIENEVTYKTTGQTSQSKRFYISSIPLDSETFAKAARAHWSVENNLHWVLDVVFHDDLMPLRTENGPKNMNIIKKMAHNLISIHPKKISLKSKLKLTAWDDNFLINIITQKIT